jgi:hypothetical protein
MFSGKFENPISNSYPNSYPNSDLNCKPEGERATSPGLSERV